MKNFPDTKPLPAQPTEDQMIAIGTYIIDGLSLEEACILVGYPEEDMRTLCDRDPVVKKIIEKKRIEFKHKHLKRVVEDPKKSEWVLETLLPEQFGKHREVTPPQNVNVLQLMFNDIQKQYDLPSALVEGGNNNAQPEKNEPRKQVEREVEYSIESVLNG